MAFPSIKPTARDFSPGNYPVREFRSQSGTEIRILYGDARTGMELNLSYDNITDSNADLFLAHFDDMKGTFGTFDINTEVKAGWSGDTESIDTDGNNVWRYAEPPQVTAVRPGFSSVRVKLIGVL